jgi:hypothetical protein
MDLSLLIVAVVSLAIGYLANSFFTGRQVSQKSDEVQPSSQPVPEPGTAAIELTAGPEIIPATTTISDKTRLDMASFWREQPSGALRADMDGRTIKAGSELSPEQHRRLEMVDTDLRLWLTPSTAAAPSIEPERTEVTPPVVQTVIPRPIAIPALPTPLVPGTDGKLPASKSIVGQIDDILQDKLVGTSLQDRRIRLIEIPGHGVAVKIGIDQYAAIDDVPDPEIKAIIRAAVKIWEGRAG